MGWFDNHSHTEYSNLRLLDCINISPFYTIYLYYIIFLYKNQRASTKRLCALVTAVYNQRVCSSKSKGNFSSTTRILSHSLP